jgi:YHS domain-containing protein
MNIDPLCGKEFTERDPEHASEINGRIYFFCSLTCKKEFDREQRYWTERLAAAQQ